MLYFMFKKVVKMGQVGSKKADPFIVYHPKVDMQKNDEPAKELTMSGRIATLTASIDNLEPFEISKKFYKDFSKINACIGDREVQGRLLELRDKIRKNDKDYYDLAFQIQCTAQAMIPDPVFQLEKLPNELQQRIPDLPRCSKR